MNHAYKKDWQALGRMLFSGARGAGSLAVNRLPAERSHCDDGLGTARKNRCLVASLHFGFLRSFAPTTATCISDSKIARLFWSLQKIQLVLRLFS